MMISPIKIRSYLNYALKIIPSVVTFSYHHKKSVTKLYTCQLQYEILKILGFLSFQGGVNIDGVPGCITL
jgi:hypothetical protein